MAENEPVTPVTPPPPKGPPTTVKAFKVWAKDQGFGTEQVKQVFIEKFGDHAFDAYLERDDADVELRRIPTGEPRPLPDTGKKPRPRVTVPGAKLDVSAQEARRELVREAWKAEGEKAEKELVPFPQDTAVPPIPEIDVARYQTPEEVESMRELTPGYHRKIMETGGFKPIGEVREPHRRLMFSRAQARQGKALERSKKKRQTREWLSKEAAYKMLQGRSDLAKRFRDVGYHHRGKFVTSVMSELDAIAHGGVKGMFELMYWAKDQFDMPGRPSDTKPLAEKMEFEALASYVERLERHYGRDKEGNSLVPGDMKEAIEAGKMYIHADPSSSKAYNFGAAKQKKLQDQLEKDFERIYEEDPGLALATWNDLGDVAHGLFALVSGVFGGQDSPYVDKMYDSGDTYGYYDARFRERTEHYANLVNFIPAHYAVMSRGDLKKQWMARPVTTTIAIIPPLKMIKTGLHLGLLGGLSTKAGRAAQAKAAAAIAKVKATLTQKVGPERVAAMFNIVDKITLPPKAFYAGTKRWVGHRATQLNRAATEVMRELFSKPMRIRAENQAMYRRARVTWKQYEKMERKLLKKGYLTGADELALARKMDEIIGELPAGEAAATMEALAAIVDKPELGMPGRRDPVVEIQPTRPKERLFFPGEGLRVERRAPVVEIKPTRPKERLVFRPYEPVKEQYVRPIVDPPPVGPRPKTAEGVAEAVKAARDADWQTVSAVRPIATDARKPMRDIFESASERGLGRWDPWTESWEFSGRTRPALVYDQLIARMNEAKASGKIPRDFVEPIVHIPTKGLSAEAMKRAAAEGLNSELFKAASRTDQAYKGYRPLHKDAAAILEYGRTGHRVASGRPAVETFRRVGGKKLQYYVHPAIEQTLNAINAFMKKKGIGIAEINRLRKTRKGLEEARTSFNKAMGEFERTHTWNRAALPESVNSFINQIVQNRWPKYTRMADKSKLLAKNAPVSSLKEWMAEYHPGKALDEIAIDGTKKIPREVLENPAALKEWLKKNSPSLNQYFFQRGIKNPLGTAQYNTWVKHKWPDEQHAQLVNYARWQDEGPMSSTGARIAYEPIPTNVRRRYADTNIYGESFNPYVRKNKMATTAEGKEILKGDILPVSFAIRESAGVGPRRMSVETTRAMGAWRGAQKDLVRAMKNPTTRESVIETITQGLDNAYRRKNDAMHRDIVSEQLRYSESTLARGADNLKISELPTILHISPEKYLAALKPTTPNGKLFKQMAERRFRGGRVFGGYGKVPREMLTDLKITGNIYMPKSAMRQWKWQKAALDASLSGGWFAKFGRYIKANLTAANLPTLIINTLSNFGIQMLTRGPFFFKDLVKDNVMYRMYLRGYKFDRKMDEIFRAIEESGALNSDFHRIELSQMASGIPDFTKKASKTMGERGKQVVKDLLHMRPLTKLYGGSDNVMKLNEMVLKMKSGSKWVERIRNPDDFMDFPVADGAYRRFTRPEKGGPLFVDGKKATKQQVWSALAEYGKHLANLKFFDYSDIAGFNAMIKSSHLDKIFTPFLTFTNKASYFPGVKRGLPRELFGEVKVKSNVPSVLWDQAKTNLDIYAIWSMAMAQNRQDFSLLDRDTLDQMRYDPSSKSIMYVNWLRTPGTLHVKDLTSLDVLDPTRIWIQIVDDLLGLTANPQARAFGTASPPQGVFKLPSGADRAPWETKVLEEAWETAVESFPMSGVSFEKVLNATGFGKGPLLDVLHMLEAIGSWGWMHKEFTPAQAFQALLPPLLPGSMGKAIDAYVGVVDKDSPLTTRRQEDIASYNQPEEEDARWASRRMTGFPPKPVVWRPAIDLFFKALSTEWKGRALGSKSDKSTLKGRLEIAKRRMELDTVETLKAEIDALDTVIRMSVKERKERAVRNAIDVTKAAIFKRYSETK